MGREDGRPQLGRAALAAGVRRRRHDHDGAVHLQPGDGAGAGPDGRWPGPLAARTDRARARDRRPEGAPARPHAQGRPALGAGLLRARRRLRPRFAADARPSATATSTSSTVRRCGPRPPTSRTGCFGLFRTDPEAPKHRGISFMVMPMENNGIEVRPIISMGWHHATNETFFEDVRVPANNVNRRGQPRLVRRNDAARLRAVEHRRCGHQPPAAQHPDRLPQLGPRQAAVAGPREALARRHRRPLRRVRGAVQLLVPDHLDAGERRDPELRGVGPRRSSTRSWRSALPTRR